MGLFSWLFRPKQEYERKIASPNGRIVAEVKLVRGRVFYNVKKDDKVIVNDSTIGIALRGRKSLVDGLGVIRAHERSFDEVWQTEWGEEKEIRNTYNELAL